MNEFFEEGAKFYALIHFVCDEKNGSKISISLRPWRATYTYQEEASKVVTFINEEVIL